MVSILVVMQDDQYCSFLNEYLPSMGYLPKCISMISQAFDELMTGSYQAAILEVEYEHCDGFHLLRRLRTQSDLPVLFLAKKSEPDFRATGLEMGADDFVSKEWPLRELVARIGAVLRRTGKQERQQEQIKEEIKVEDLTVNLARRQATYAGRNLELTQIEFTILQKLAQRPNRVVNRVELSREALGRDLAPFDRSIDVHVCHLRRKLSFDGRPHRIKTVRGFGYIYSASVSA